MISTENGPIKGQQLKAIIIRMPNRQMIVIIFSILLIMKLYTGGCLFSREKAVKDVKSRVWFCFLVGVILDLDWLRKN